MTFAPLFNSHFVSPNRIGKNKMSMEPTASFGLPARLRRPVATSLPLPTPTERLLQGSAPRADLNVVFPLVPVPVRVRDAPLLPSLILQSACPRSGRSASAFTSTAGSSWASFAPMTPDLAAGAGQKAQLQPFSHKGSKIDFPNSISSFSQYDPRVSMTSQSSLSRSSSPDLPSPQNSDPFSSVSTSSPPASPTPECAAPMSAVVVKKTSKAYKCVVCSKSFAKPSTLRAHSRIHTGEKPFKCSFGSCTRAFANAGDRKKHARTHTGERPYSCSVCLRSFSRSDHLAVHLRIHTGERPFSCPYCPKLFTTASNMRTHIRTHSGERPFVCLERGCNRAFSTSGNLKTHVRVHTGEKPYPCSKCNRRFAQRSDLKTHLALHTGVHAFMCEKCGAGFARPGLYKLHCESHATVADQTA